MTSLTRQVAALQDNNLDATTQGRAVRARLDRLGVQAGPVAATGPGIRVVVDDAPGATEDNQLVLDQDLQKLVNSLWGDRRRGHLDQRPAAHQPVRDP